MYAVNEPYYGPSFDQSMMITRNVSPPRTTFNVLRKSPSAGPPIAVIAAGKNGKIPMKRRIRPKAINQILPFIISMSVSRNATMSVIRETMILTMVVQNTLTVTVQPVAIQILIHGNLAMQSKVM